MAKKSSTVKELIQIIIFFLIVGVLLTGFVIYPLGVSKKLMAREDIDTYNPDSVAVNDPTAFVDAGFATDTFSVEPETYTRIAAVRLQLTDSTGVPNDLRSARPGTVILLPDERTTRDSYIPLARQLVDSGFQVITYDLRATGLSTGAYHSDGQYEATDLAEVVSYLRFRELLTHPLITVGRSAGADAALLEAREDSRVDGIVAIDPYLSTERWMDSLQSEHGTWWLPFSNTVIWFWYGLRSDYAAPYREVEHIQAADLPTLLIAGEPLRKSEEFAKFKELSAEDKLTVSELPENEDQLNQRIVEWITNRASLEPRE